MNAESRTSQAELRLGTQGWAYKDWLGAFYPPRTPASKQLEFYSRVFDTVELDTTFYGSPRPAAVKSWFDATPPEFIFAAKMPKIITHDRRLVDAEADLVDFLTAVQMLDSKLGPILVQLPPSFTTAEWSSLSSFLDILPEEFRYAVEFRHPSWIKGEAVQLLSEHEIAWAVIDLHDMPRTVQVTTDFTYVRWLGRRADVKRLDRIQLDRSADLDRWAAELDRISHDVQRIYGFMNNHYAGHSPTSLNDLRARMGLPVLDHKSLWPQQTLPMNC